MTVSEFSEVNVSCFVPCCRRGALLLDIAVIYLLKALGRTTECTELWSFASRFPHFNVYCTSFCGAAVWLRGA